MRKRPQRNLGQSFNTIFQLRIFVTLFFDNLCFFVLIFLCNMSIFKEMVRTGKPDKFKGKKKVKNVLDKKAKGLKLNKVDRKRVVKVVLFPYLKPIF